MVKFVSKDCDKLEFHVIKLIKLIYGYVNWMEYGNTSWMEAQWNLKCGLYSFVAKDCDKLEFPLITCQIYGCDNYGQNAKNLVELKQN